MEFWRGLEDPRSDRIYSSGNQGVKKGLGPRGTRYEEFLVPSLLQTNFKESKFEWSFWLYQNVLRTYVFEGIFIYVHSIYLRKWYTISYLLCGKKKIVELHGVTLH